jgi:eukaryotic-like serine/threonine-protein kinase
LGLTVEQMVRMDELLDQAMEFDAAGRRAWLEELAPENQDLFEALREVLFPQACILDSPAALGRENREKKPTSGLVPGARVGRYELIRLLGSGGMAEVWLAKRADGMFKREVALKLPMVSRLRKDLEERFIRERDILASLEHPNIARLYDGGIDTQGLPYLAMEYVPGAAITAWCDERKLGIQQRLKLFLHVLEAVQYAHAHQVIHRDLKPSNILVSEAGEVRLLDFGVAKLLAQEGDEAQLTSAYGRAMTPDYASPEQLKGDLMDARSDIYSLAVLLYELLVGGRPHRLNSGASLGMLEHSIATAEVKKPSSQIEPEAAAARATVPERLARELRGDLDIIVLKALAKEPAERYESTAAMRADLERYLSNRPIQARPVLLAYRARKFVVRNRPIIAITVLAAALITTFGGYQLRHRWMNPSALAAPPLEVPPHSIAVLPFVNMSADKEQEYFADGMAEEIIDLLARVPALRVPARTSSFYFKGRQTKVPEIARELGVAMVLEGSVRQSGHRLRVTAELIQANTGYHVWSQSYERNLDDIFKVQDDIANSVVQAMQVTLLGAPREGQDGATQNIEAYQLYLRGLSSIYINTPAALRAADDYFDQAYKLDPTFAKALTEKASVAVIEAELGVLRPEEGFERARRLALEALRVAPRAGAPHYVLGFVNRTYDWDWNAARAELAEGLEIDPTSPNGGQYYCSLLKTLGEWDEALRCYRAILVRDPLSTFGHFNLGATLYLSGRYAEAETELTRLRSFAPEFSWASVYLAKTLLAEGKADAAAVELRRGNGDAFQRSMLPIVLQAVGRNQEADEVLNEVKARFADNEAYAIAMVYANRNDHDQAIQWLERAYRQKDVGLIEIVGERLFDNLKDDPRFRAFLKKMNFPES